MTPELLHSPLAQRLYQELMRGDCAEEVLRNFDRMLRREAAEAQLEASRRRGARRALHKADGEVEMAVNAYSWAYWQRREPGCWDDEQFRREFRRDVPESRVRYVPERPQVGYEGAAREGAAKKRTAARLEKQFIPDERRLKYRKVYDADGGGACGG